MGRIGILALSMVAAVAAVAVLARWDARREADAGLEDFAADRVVLANTAAGQLAARLDEARRDALEIAEDQVTGRQTAVGVTNQYLRVAIRHTGEPPGPPAAAGAVRLSVPIADGRIVDLTMAAADLFQWLARVERPDMVFLIRVPGESALRSSDGATVAATAVGTALELGVDHVHLDRDRAARLGLPARTAIAGLARVDAPPFGRWSVAAVASAEDERDRDRRAAWRLVLAILVAGSLVGAFGGIAIRVQRKEAQLERELAARAAARARDEKLAQLDRAATMVTLASGVAHELSTPLGVIVGRAEQLLASAREARDERAVRAILDQAGRIHEVVRGFLGLARGAPPSAETIAPSAIVDAAVALVEHRFARAGVTLTRKAAGPLPLVRCDRRLIEHALVNLLLNACDACARGGHVDVAVDAADGSVRFTVIDDGAGISADAAERALEPFFTTKAHGTGLGLAIANEIMKTHRGALSIGPAAPHGTRACLTLPIGEERAHAA